MSDFPIVINIPLTPRTKKNHSRIIHVGRAHALVPSAAYKRFEHDCGLFLPGRYRICLNEPLNVAYEFRLPTHHRIDVPNLIAAMDDILTLYGVISDDNSRIVFTHDGTYARYDKKNPGVTITITPAVIPDGVTLV